MQIIEKVRNSEIFKHWHTDEYLVSYNLMDDVQNVNFYSKRTKKITTFAVSDHIEMKEDQVFQNEARDLEELNLREVSIDLNMAMEQVDKIKNMQIPSDLITKKIIILYQEKVPVWNLTYINSNFNVLTVKINAIDGEVIDKQLQSVFNMRKTRN